jgi:hypothetical protein
VDKRRDSKQTDLFEEDLYCVITGNSHVSTKGNYYFTAEEAFEVKDVYEKKILDQIRKEPDGRKVEEFRYLLKSLRVEKVLFH